MSNLSNLIKVFHQTVHKLSPSCNNIFTRNISLKCPLNCFPSALTPNLEPAFLNDTEPKIGKHETINLMMFAYDHIVLQEYQGWIHNKLLKMNLVVQESFGTPSADYEITKIKKDSNIIEEKYNLKKYQRSVTISELPAPLLPIVTEVVQASLPEGVEVVIDHHREEHENVRYIPDYYLDELRENVAHIREFGAKPTNTKYKAKPKKKE